MYSEKPSTKEQVFLVENKKKRQLTDETLHCIKDIEMERAIPSQIVKHNYCRDGTSVFEKISPKITKNLRLSAQNQITSKLYNTF